MADAVPGVPATALTGADIGTLPPLGQDYTGSVPMLGRAIALPSGAWRVIAQQKSTFRGYPPGAMVDLLRMQGNRMTGVIEIGGNATARPSSTGWPLNPICAAAANIGHEPALLGGDTRQATDSGDQDCVLVTYQATSTWRDPGQPPARGALARTLDQLGIVPPATAILLAFGQTNAQSRLTEQLWLNPELSGLPAAGPRAWTASRLKHDAKRRAYLRHLLSWAEGWRGVMRQALTDPAARPSESVAEIR